MKKSNWRFILSTPDNGPNNMAIDEALFLSNCIDEFKAPVFRLYSWSAKCATIGYFQKHTEFTGNIDVTRRLTGGLSVEHNNDLSYSFVISKPYWQHVYDQEKTYFHIHSSIKNALSDTGIKTEFSPQKQNIKLRDKKNICVHTIYSNDLLIGNKKILGSCQRRRGNVILVQGSIHISKLSKNLKEFSSFLISHLSSEFNAKFNLSQLSKNELSEKLHLSEKKYNLPNWNRKF
ncbi:biotin/lipoate A/B protein ligase family protein [Elusimicrobiota bacterium]